VALRTLALWTRANGETIPQNQYLSSKTDLETPNRGGAIGRIRFLTVQTHALLKVKATHPQYVP
jgi:hypothetical protein